MTTCAGAGEPSGWTSRFQANRMFPEPLGEREVSKTAGLGVPLDLDEPRVREGWG